MGYQEYKGLDLVAIGQQVRKFWEEQQIFEKSVSERQGAPSFVFFEGPPSANGTPGIHHVMGRTVKDLFCRYKTLKGFQVKRKGGWDTHGLPVELKVEKELGINKEDIGTKISVEDYNKACRQTVMEFKGQWDELTQQMGYWVDLKNPYVTFEKPYIESLWHLLKKLYDKDMLYKGYTIQPYSPAAGTGLSSHELNQPGCYRDVKDTSITAQFKLLRNEASEALFQHATPEVFALAWTTTPWTLSSNAALAVGEHITYALVKTYNPYTFQPVTLLLAKDRLAAYFSEKQAQADFDAYQPGDKLIPYALLGEYSGKQLVGLRYEQLLPYVQPEGDAFRIIAGDFVTTEDGTGIVHIAPTFGADDKRVADQAGVPAITVQDENGKEMPLVDRTGRYVAQMGEFGGQFIKAEYEADEVQSSKDYRPMDVRIAIKLKEENRAFKVEKYEHSYPHCWRTDKPVLYYPLDSWFIRTTAVKDRMVELNKTINWKPAATGSGRFGNWLENLVDWNLSRSRYWGTPLPIWRTEDGSEEICIGSIAELEAELEKAVAAGIMPADSRVTQEGKLAQDFDLHRPFVDEVVLVSSKGEPMRRESDLIDVWFDSGAMPYAQWHYPFENQDIFDGSFPADFIAEGVDQTRGWFFTLHAIATMISDSVAFKNVVSNGLVLDKNGEKMSKRLGNVIDPFKTMNDYGPDATRWYMIENANPWDNLKFDLGGIEEVRRKFFGTLYNTYSFFALYANLDSFVMDPAKQVPVAQRTELDRWILSALQTLKQEVDRAFEELEPTRAARLIQEFVGDNLSNWYVRLSRKRFWLGEMSADKQAAYETLYTCLLEVSQLMAPIAPFFADWLYRNLTEAQRAAGTLPTSVHLCIWEAAEQSLIDQDLEERMALAQTICSLTHSIRKKEKLKVRQPLKRILVPDVNAKVTEQIKAIEPIIAAEVNIKHIEFLTEESAGMFVKKIKPNLPLLGKKYGKLMKVVSGAINGLDQDGIRAFEESGELRLQAEGQELVLTLEEVFIESDDIPGWSIAKERGLTVALDITLNDELRMEGIARDIVNRVQNLRKDMGLEVQDKIRLTAQEEDALVAHAIKLHKAYICAEVQALSLELLPQVQEATELDLDDYRLRMKVEVAR